MSQPKQESIPQPESQDKEVPPAEQNPRTWEQDLNAQMDFLKRERTALLKEMKDIEETVLQGGYFKEGELSFFNISEAHSKGKLGELLKDEKDMGTVASLLSKYDEHYAKNLSILGQFSNLKEALNLEGNKK